MLHPYIFFYIHFYNNFFILFLKIREAEYLIANKREKGFIKGPVHLGIGQEAIAVGEKIGFKTKKWYRRFVSSKYFIDYIF